MILLQIILLQLITIGFNIFLAENQSSAVTRMRDYGAERKEEKRFHLSSFMIRFMFCGVAASYAFLLGVNGWAVLLLLGLLSWLVFDLALNVFTGKKWHYLGDTAFLDRLVRNGKLKAAIVALFILILNLWLNKQT